MRWNTILFDLDGTVTDPKVGITSAAAYALRTLGLGDHDPDTLTPFIGPPLHLIFPRYGAQSDEQIDRAVGGLEYQRAQNRNHKRYQFL